MKNILLKENNYMEDFILNIPKWEGKIRISYDVVEFVLVWLIFITGLLLCFRGYKLSILLSGNTLFKKMYIVSPIAGGVVISGVVYFKIYHNIWVTVVLFLCLAIVGSLYGKSKTVVRKPFFTYDDLYRMQPLKAGDTDA